ncbi:MAG TPA: hypothetical protein DCE41_26380 [Cytophagales bacterium]|nr:hypothetical protein [Cytophagales bacterium]HAA17706.1 hypothetical protein [Cytophagales bacterium]HAP61211.1 hypothetical protein [Cytophagales bacterium]
MKELLQGLNLPKQVLDKTEKLMITLFGPSAKEMSELFADKVRYRRMKNQISIFSKTADLMEKKGLDPRGLDLKTLVPLIEFSSLEEDENLQQKWVNLIANISSTPASGLESKLVKTLSNLSSLEAQILDHVYDEFVKKRATYFEIWKTQEWFKLSKAEEISVNSVSYGYLHIQQSFELDDLFAKIYIDNLDSLGLIKYDEPEIVIDKGVSAVEIEKGEDGDSFNPEELEITAEVSQTDDFKLTNYGKYFIEQCKS